MVLEEGQELIVGGVDVLRQDREAKEEIRDNRWTI